MSKDFKILSDVEHIQKRPGMYIGELNTPIHLLWELLDNSLDEVLNGYADLIDIEITRADNKFYYKVRDNGRGLPILEYKKQMIPIWAITKLFSGEKFEHKVYKKSIGLNGVGLVAVNALSSYFHLKTINNNKQLILDCVDGILKNNELIDSLGSSCTEIVFSPSDRHFDSLEIDESIVIRRLELVKAIIPKCKLNFNGKEIIHNEFKDLIPGDKSNNLKTYLMIEGTDYKLVLTYDINLYNVVIEGAINLLPVNSGTHINLLGKSVIDAWSSMIQDKDIKDTDVLVGLRAFIALDVEEAAYSSQTKNILTTKQILLKPLFADISLKLDKLLNSESLKKSFVQPLIKKFELYREYQNKLSSINIIDKVVKYGSIDNSGVSRTTNVKKLSDCLSRDREKTELFIVEGESAGGTLKKARDKKIHAILSLRGKVLNVQGLTMNRIFQNPEIKSLVNAIGIGVRPKEDISKIRYSKIIICSDGDPDGKSIEALIIGALAELIPSIIENGRLYVCQAPLYKQNNIFYYNESSLDKSKPFRRYKGLGEFNPNELKEFALSDNRNLIKIVGDSLAILSAKKTIGTSSSKKRLVVDNKLVEVN